MSDDSIGLIIDARPIQLIDWMIGEFSVNPVDGPSETENSVAITGTSISSPEDSLYVLNMMLDINPPASDEKRFTYKCRATAKFVVTDAFEGNMDAVSTLVLTDGMAELYTLIKAYVFMMTGNSENESVVLPSIVVTEDK